MIRLFTNTINKIMGHCVDKCFILCDCWGGTTNTQASQFQPSEIFTLFFILYLFHMLVPLLKILISSIAWKTPTHPSKSSYIFPALESFMWVSHLHTVEKNCHRKLSCWIFITYRVLLLTSLGLKACLNQHFFFLSFMSKQMVLLFT